MVVDSRTCSPGRAGSAAPPEDVKSVLRTAPDNPTDCVKSEGELEEPVVGEGAPDDCAGGQVNGPRAQTLQERAHGNRLLNAA